MKKFFEKTKIETVTYFACFYANNKNFMIKLWTALAVTALIGVASGAANAERFFSGTHAYLFKSLAAFGGVGFFEGLLHAVYFALVYLAAVNIYLSAVGFVTVFYAAFKLGAGMAAMTALYGLGGFINAILIYLPVNLILTAALSSYLAVCLDYSRRGKRLTPEKRKPCYTAALREGLYFLIPVFAADIIAYLILL
ncbi:MAG: hypothetical protein LBP79_07255 [Clostridiales bacterium]|jgi:hypothetical protein|nr:hypothetical protein [Clostridiales bacterium]